MDGWLTVEAVAEATGLSIQVVRIACQRRQLASERRGRLWAIREDAVGEWLQQRTERLDLYWRLRKARGSDAAAGIGQTPWEVKDRQTREQLLATAKTGEPAAALAALKTLSEKPYRIRLPLVEQRLGVTLSRGGA